MTEGAARLPAAPTSRWKRSPTISHRPASRSSAARFSLVNTPESPADRKSTRLNSSHGYISYAVFCLKKKKKTSDRIVRSPGSVLGTLKRRRALVGGMDKTLAGETGDHRSHFTELSVQSATICRRVLR